MFDLDKVCLCIIMVAVKYIHCLWCIGASVQVIVKTLTIDVRRGVPYVGRVCVSLVKPICLDEVCVIDNGGPALSHLLSCRSRKTTACAWLRDHVSVEFDLDDGVVLYTIAAIVINPLTITRTFVVRCTLSQTMKVLLTYALPWRYNSKNSSLKWLVWLY